MSRQVDGATPQLVQKMTYDELLLFVVKQRRLTNKVVTFYEAGAFGFQNYVVQPQDWDERGKGVKNDRLDAAALWQRLDRYERGKWMRNCFSHLRHNFFSLDAGALVRPAKPGASGWVKVRAS